MPALTLAVIYLLAVIALIWSDLILFGMASPYSIFLIVLFITLFIGASFLASRQLRSTHIKNAKLVSLDIPFVISLCLITCGIYLRWTNFHAYSLWLDDHTQMIGATSNPLSQVPIVLQQAPLSYFYSFLSANWFGFTEVGARFFPFLLSCGTLLLAHYWSRQLRLHVLSHSLLMGSLCLSGFLIHYSFSSRPYSLSVFMGLLGVVAFTQLIQSKGHLWRELTLLFLCLTGFIYSAGFVPLMTVLCCAVIFPVASFFFSKEKKKLLMAGGAAITSLIVFLPTHIMMTLQAQQYLKSSASSLHSIFEFENWSLLQQTWLRLVQLHPLFDLHFVGAILSLFIFGFLMSRRPPSSLIKLNLSALFAISSSCLILAFSIFVFFSFINWDYYDRYAILWVLYLSIAGALIFQAIERFTLQIYPLEKVMNGVSLLAAIILLVSFTQQFPQRFRPDVWEPDHRAVFDYINEHSVGNTLVHPLYPIGMGNWVPKGVYLQEFYLDPKQKHIFAPSSWELPPRLRQTNNVEMFLFWLGELEEVQTVHLILKGQPVRPTLIPPHGHLLTVRGLQLLSVYGNSKYDLIKNLEMAVMVSSNPKHVSGNYKELSQLAENVKTITLNLPKESEPNGLIL